MKHFLSKIPSSIATPGALAGAFLGATVAAMIPGGNGLPGLLVGWLYGIVVGALVRAFRVPPGAYPLAGLVAGPVPLAVLMPAHATGEERGVLVLGLVSGLLLGLFEWGHARFRAGRGAGSPPPDPVPDGAGPALR